MQKQSIKHITFVRFSQIFLLAIITIVIVMFLAYREFFRVSVENKALEISTVIKAGLTSHMKAGIMDKRDYFLNEIKNINDINSISIVRGDAVNKQFGTSTHSVDSNNISLKALSDLKEPYFEWNNSQGIVKAIIPYRASASGKLNCLQCHIAKDGEVLGALELEMDIKSYQNLTTNYGYVFIGMLLFFALLIILNIFNFMERYIAKPLAKIVLDGEHAYLHNSSIDVAKYEVKELVKLAINLNDFNHDIMDKEEEIEETLRETMLAMGEIEDIRSSETRNHTKRVSKLCGLIAKAHGLSEEEVNLIILTSPLHDIGKIGISDAILLKPGKLTEDEYEIMKTHAELGFNVLRHSERIVLKTAADIAHSHHEKYDGSGYPQGIKGEEIPLFARIVAIVDVLDALLCKRIYKEAWKTQDVYEHITQQSGKHFDPRLARIVLDNFDEYVKVVEDMSVKEERE